MTKLDYKKEYKNLYQPKEIPSRINVPEINFLMIEGKGDPNEVNGEYQKAVEVLYALSYTIKMSYKGEVVPKEYFEYVVPPLEGLWWLEDESDMDFTQKSKYSWISMIRQPEFVTEEVLKWALGEASRKKPELDFSKAFLKTFTEGECVQVMHLGKYDDEPATIEKMEKYINENNLLNDIGNTSNEGHIRRHHEIYLSDPRKAGEGKMKTIIRHPVRDR